jgi:type II secretory pathway component GspD/PulD (secretin)
MTLSSKLTTARCARLALAAALCAVPVLSSAQTSGVPTSSNQAKPDPKKAESAYLDGARLVDRGDLARAEPLFARAVELNPSKAEYAEALQRVRAGRVADLIQQSAKARMAGNKAQADSLLAAAIRIDPRNPQVLQQTADAVAPRLEITPVNGPEIAFAGAIQLAPLPETHEFHLHADAQQVVRQVGEAYGVKAVFDESAGHTDLRFWLDAAPYDVAMPILLRMAHLFAVPLDEHTILLSKDTQENRQRFERQMEETIYVPGSTNEQMSELTNIIKNVFDVKQVSNVNSSGTLLIRAPEPTLKVVNATLADLIDGGSEVMLELKLYSVDKTKGHTTGASVPQQYGAFSVVGEAESLVSANQSTLNAAISAGYITLTGNRITDLITEVAFLLGSGAVTSAQFTGFLGTIGGGLSLLGVYQVGGATFNLSTNSSEVRAIDDVQVRVGDRQTNTFRVGSKYPITTSTYTTGSGVSSTATINGTSIASLLAKYGVTTGTTATTPMIQYEDLGLTLKTTPAVLKSGLVSVHLDMKIEALTGSSLDGNPILTSRALASDVTLQDGTTAVLVSHLSKSEIGSLNGVPGLSELPGFQDATEKTTEQDSSELVITITPRIIRSHRNESAGPRMAFQTSVPQDY